MFLIRRVCIAKPWKEYEVAELSYKLAKAYEKAGRSECRVYTSGAGTPGPARHVYIDWLTEKIESQISANIPQEVDEVWEQLEPLLEEYPIEFYEMVTAERIPD